MNYRSTDDYDCVMRIIRYLSCTIGYGLCFYGTMRINHLFCYSDAAFGSDNNYASCTGVLVMYSGAPILCKAKMITKSSCEADLVAL